MAGPTCLKSTPNDRFFEKLFMVILFTLRAFARNLLEEKNIFCSRCLTNRLLSNKSTYYILDCGERISNLFDQSTLYLFQLLTHPQSY